MDDHHDSTGWTGELSMPEPRQVSLRAQSARVRILVILGVFLGVALVLLLNGRHVRQWTEPATVSWVRFIPAHAESHGWAEDAWDVHISLRHDDTDLVLHAPPPDWLGQNKPLTVTYGFGRIYHDVLLYDVHPGG